MSDSAETLRIWRAAHPDKVKQHRQTQHAKRRADKTYTLDKTIERRRQKRLNDISREQADRAHRKWSKFEDDLVQSGQPARSLATQLGRSINSIAGRRYRLRARS